MPLPIYRLPRHQRMVGAVRNRIGAATGTQTQTNGGDPDFNSDRQLGRAGGDPRYQWQNDGSS